MLLKSKRW